MTYKETKRIAENIVELLKEDERKYKMTCKDCAFVMNKEHNLPRGSYPCLTCRDNALFNRALKDCPSYFCSGKIPKNMSIGEFAKKVRH